MCFRNYSIKFKYDPGVQICACLTSFSLSSLGPLIWIAVPDNDIISSPFLPGKAEDLMASGDFNTEVEILIGTNKDEGILNVLGTIYNDPQFWDYMRNNIETFVPSFIFNIADKSEITGVFVIR